MTIKAVILDWAGTVIDFGSRAPVVAMKAVFAEADTPVDDATVRRFMGMAKREHVVAMLSEPEVAARWVKAHGADWTERDVDRLMTALEPAMQRAASECADLIPGAAETVEMLRAEGLRIGSTTGYTRAMMSAIAPRASAQGYQPDCLICADDTLQGRPAPLMIWKVLVDFGIWPAFQAVVVDDATVGIEAGRNAGCWTVAVAASGNALGLSHAAYAGLPREVLGTKIEPAVEGFKAAGADLVIETIADLGDAIERINAWLARGERPGEGPTEILLS